MNISRASYILSFNNIQPHAVSPLVTIRYVSGKLIEIRWISK